MLLLTCQNLAAGKNTQELWQVKSQYKSTIALCRLHRWNGGSMTLGDGAATGLQAAEVPLKLAQTAAVMEVLHSILGIVRSPVMITGKASTCLCNLRLL